MKIRFFLGLTLIISLMFAGCTKESDSKSDSNSEPGPDSVVALKLSNPASSRTDGNEEQGDDAKNENTIKNVEIWVFKENGSLAVYKNFQGPKTSYKFVVPGAGDNMKFLVSVNQTVGTATTYDEAVKKIAAAPVYTTTTTTADGNTRTVPDSLAMTGWTTASVTPATSETSPTTTISVSIIRLVSKVEAPKVKSGGATLAIPESDLKNLFERPGLVLGDVDFAMTGFVLINGLDKTSVFNYWNATGVESDPWSDEWRVGKTYLNSAFKTAPPAEIGQYEEVYSGSKDGAGLFLDTPTDVVYVYENSPLKDTDEPTLYFDKTTVYSFVIKGTLTDKVATVTKTRYWKANLIPDDNHKILRNTIYRMEIVGVNSIGYGNPKDAEEEVVPQAGNASVQISINIAKWRVKFQSTIL